MTARKTVMDPKKRNAQTPFSNSSILLFEYVAAIVFVETRFW
jgi:hypothetical protein